MMLRSQVKNIEAPVDRLPHKRKQTEQLDAQKQHPNEPAAKKQISKVFQGLTELRAHISGFTIDSAKRAPFGGGKPSKENDENTAPGVNNKIDPCPHYDYDQEEAHNPESVSEYAPEIFDYYKSRELQFRVENYLQHHPEIDVKTRAILIDWMVEIQETFELNHETLYNAVKLTDMYLNNTKNVDKATIQKLACVTIFIAAKYDERSPPLVDDLIYLSGDRFTRDELLAMERNLFSAVGYDLGSPLSYRYLRRLGRVCRVDMKSLTMARYILETSLLVYDYAFISQARLAAAAFVLAMRMLDKEHKYEWNPVLEKYSGFTGDEVYPLVEHMNHIMHFTNAKWNQLGSVRQKYSHEVFFHVAQVPFLPDTLKAVNSHTYAPIPQLSYP